MLAAAETGDPADRGAGRPEPPVGRLRQPVQPVPAGHQVAYVQAHSSRRTAPWAPFNPEDEYYLIRN